MNGLIRQGPCISSQALIDSFATAAQASAAELPDSQGLIDAFLPLLGAPQPPPEDRCSFSQTLIDSFVPAAPASASELPDSLGLIDAFLPLRGASRPPPED